MVGTRDTSQLIQRAGTNGGRRGGGVIDEQYRMSDGEAIWTHGGGMRGRNDGREMSLNSKNSMSATTAVSAGATDPRSPSPPAPCSAPSSAESSAILSSSASAAACAVVAAGSRPRGCSAVAAAPRRSPPSRSRSPCSSNAGLSTCLSDFLHVGRG